MDSWTERSFSKNITAGVDFMDNVAQQIGDYKQDVRQASIGILSDETIVGQHPWVDDPQEELERLKKQEEKQQAEFERQQGYNPFKQSNSPQDKGGVNEE